jgi:hypothetical protein
MPLQDGFQLVDKALKANKFNLPLSVAALLPDAADRGKRAGTIFGRDECETGYLPGVHHELEVWHVSLMLAEYLAWLIGEKVKDGHCKHHKPCSEMRKEHKRMLRTYKETLEKLAGEIGALERDLAPIL